jgi:hypothetical protein
LAVTLGGNAIFSPASQLTENSSSSPSKPARCLNSKHALFFRSIFVPSLASALTRVREGDAEVVAVFSNQVEQRLKRRLASHPAPMHSFVQTIVLAKDKED